VACPGRWPPRWCSSAGTAGALTTAATIGETFTETLLVLLTLAFLLHGGANIWQFLLRAAPGRTRTRVDVAGRDVAGRRSLATLVSYVRATATVAVVDTVGIGVGLAALGVPLAVPLAALVVPVAIAVLLAAPLLAAPLLTVPLLTVPLLAVLNSGVRSLLSDADAHVNPADVHASQPEGSTLADPELATYAE